MQNVQKILVFFIFSVIIFSCSRDKVSPPSCNDVGEPTYDNEIVGIINGSCATVNCHVAGFQFGDLSTYDKTKLYTGDDFINRILSGNMPPADAFDELTDLEKLQLQCWHQNQYPEN